MCVDKFYYSNCYNFAFRMLLQYRREKPFIYFPFTQTRVPCDAVSFQHGFLRTVRKSAPRVTKRIDYREMLY